MFIKYLKYLFIITKIIIVFICNREENKIENEGGCSLLRVQMKQKNGIVETEEKRLKVKN